jgi:hypothetical protein
LCFVWQQMEAILACAQEPLRPNLLKSSYLAQKYGLKAVTVAPFSGSIHRMFEEDSKVQERRNRLVHASRISSKRGLPIDGRLNH